jgi:hypothetical protein
VQQASIWTHVGNRYVRSAPRDIIIHKRAKKFVATLERDTMSRTQGQRRDKNVLLENTHHQLPLQAVNAMEIALKGFSVRKKEILHLIPKSALLRDTERPEKRIPSAQGIVCLDITVLLVPGGAINYHVGAQANIVLGVTLFQLISLTVFMETWKPPSMALATSWFLP